MHQHLWRIFSELANPRHEQGSSHGMLTTVEGHACASKHSVHENNSTQMNQVNHWGSKLVPRITHTCQQQSELDQAAFMCPT
eukprot:1159190-Pelagomonas_calceolata.AAC.10